MQEPLEIGAICSRVFSYVNQDLCLLSVQGNDSGGEADHGGEAYNVYVITKGRHRPYITTETMQGESNSENYIKHIDITLHGGTKI